MLREIPVSFENPTILMFTFCGRIANRSLLKQMVQRISTVR